jgi:myo-inositol-1(or 4)-monophosphatase
MNIDYNLVKELKEVILKSYDEALKLDKNIRNKELNDIVTDVDIYMETKIIEKIKKLFPTHSIYSEERGEIIGESEYVWFIDPIDGTINFAAGIPLYSTSVALKKNDETIFGIVIDYNQNDIYYAFKGEGAYCNDKKISVSDNDKLNNSILSFCLTSHYNNEHIMDVLEVERKLASKVRGLRLVVSGAIELCWCASGKIDGVINVKPSIGLSSAAGKLFVEEAGGKITNLKGEKRKKIDTLLVTNGKIHNELLGILEENL